MHMHLIPFGSFNFVNNHFIHLDTLIVWTEPDGVDYALSFQDPDGCAEVWNFIIEVQRHMNSNGWCSQLFYSNTPNTSSR